MTEQQREEEFLERIKQRLDESAEQTDELTLARLGAARRRAVEAGSRRHGIWPLSDVLAAGRGRRYTWLVGAFLLVLLVAIWRLQMNAAPPQTLLFDDMELLGAAEELEFYQELDFFIWAADERNEG
jgi:hypothetical protein